ncbi:MAG: hypothetical protein Q8O89_01495 [Nanoarchaeota archaeon]|nr:hypothetical protein [Nanoarchaeota archaeon]
MAAELEEFEFIDEVIERTFSQRKTANGPDYAAEGNVSYLICSDSGNIHNIIVAELQNKGFRYYKHETHAQKARLKNRFDILEVYKKNQTLVHTATTKQVNAATEYYSKVMNHTPFKRIVLDKDTQNFKYIHAMFKGNYGIEFLQSSNERFLMHYS